MKNIWLFALIATLVGWSCEEKDNMDPVGNWDISAPTLSTPGADAAFVLDETAPDEAITFEWEPASTTNRFGIAYTVLLVPEGSDDFANPIMRLTPGNAGRETTVTATAADIDYALWAACDYPAGATVPLEWVVIAQAIEKQGIARNKISFTRFETEYPLTTMFIYGSGAEAGADANNATPMRAVPDANGDPSGVFEVYTTLTSGGTYAFTVHANPSSRQYGGADGTLAACGDVITAPETGQYRVTVDVNNNTYDLLKIDRWSLVGDAVEGGWGGDVPLQYQGNGVWGGEIEFLSDAGFVFRANGAWEYLLKRIVGTASADNKGGDLVMESEGNALGVVFEDIPGAFGKHTVTLDLTGDGYTYTLVEVVDQGPVVAVIGETTNPTGDAVSGNFNIEDMATPDELYLLSGGAVVAQLTKDGDIFTSEGHLALEASKTYTLNTASDGSGDDVVGADIGVARDQAYKVTVDFALGKLIWKYYNMKLFHWDEVGGGWDARQELVMTYIHPYKFEVTGVLTAGFDSKFNSPWDIQFGTASTELTGTMTNGGPNYKGITQNGTYKASIEVTPDFESAKYSFVKQ